VDQLHKGLPKKMVCACGWPPLLLPVSVGGGTRWRVRRAGVVVV
jgi:hypothetical protein